MFHHSDLDASRAVNALAPLVYEHAAEEEKDAEDKYQEQATRRCKEARFSISLTFAF